MSSVFLEESDVLKSIYFDDVDVGESYVEYKAESATLKLLISDNYPIQIPEVLIKALPEVQHELVTFAKTLIGSPMIYDIIEEFKRLLNERQSRNIQPLSVTETIDSRSFLNETPFSKDSFLKWVSEVQGALVDDFAKRQDKETGKALFQRIRGQSGGEYDALIEETNE